ncbi:MAG TPA: type I DNA topoisomerase [Ktedonobacterales bacterium]|jgi:DNA topoisomerase-1|nr:type I DNA topoisomerase [Ktedonobacterales bacterium]
MAKNLVIVESPAKAKTIEKFLGSDFEVRASMGHIMDLPQKGLGVDVRHDFQPKYVVIEKKDRLVADLKAASKKADTVYLAPDPDREGEFIAWSLKHLLGLKQPKRAVFNEITRHAVQDAISNPREIDENLFNAQQARRVLDRLVGYKISPLLWRRVQSGTSAGRVQSVAVRLICDREDEVRAFTPEEYWTIEALLSKEQERKTFTAQLIGRQNSPEAAAAQQAAEGETSAANAASDDASQQRGDRGRIRITSGEEARGILAELEGATYRVRRVEQRDVRRQPFLPYTTSTLQQDASVRLRIKPKRTMSLAQQLYEGIELGDAGHQGLITYMRTDSTRISDEAQAAVKDYIRKTFSKEHVGAGRTSRGKAKANVQDAHEAIRPTDVTITPERAKPYLTPDLFKLYQLVWRRFVAAFMAPAIFDTLRIDISAGDFLFRANGSTLKFAGFYAVWPREEDADALPSLTEGESLNLHKLSPTQHFTQPPPRYTEASLIKELEERGIGRPSTFVPIVSAIQDRGYVEQKERRFTPTWLGETVNDLMRKHFGDIVDVNFTAEMERKLDSVEDGKQGWTEFLKDFYAELRTELERAEEEMGKVQKPVEELDEACPECGKQLVIRTSRFGRFVSCSGYPECSYKRALVAKTGVLCPKCGGDIVERRGKKSGKIFYGCANFPTCDFVAWDRPLTIPCPECQGLLTLPNGKEEAVCVRCGALVRGIQENAPVVVGHRPPEAERPRRGRRTPSADGAKADGADGAVAASARRTATRATRTTRTTRTTSRTTRAASGTKRATTRTAKATGAKKAGTKAATTRHSATKAESAAS